MDIILENYLVSDTGNAADLLVGVTGLSKTKVKDAMKKGAVWLESEGRTRRLRRASARLMQGDKISVYYSTSVLETEAPLPRLISDEKQFSVWNKPPGLMSGGTRFGDYCAINRVVERKLDRPTFLVHRLDRFVWGLMVLAHSKKAAAYLSHQFQRRETKKVYKAVVKGLIEEPTTISEPIDRKEAISYVLPLARSTDQSLIQIQIETGRKHQIRKHLASAGHPIIGDRLYGDPASGPELLLASTFLAFQKSDDRTVQYHLDESLHPSI